MVGACSKSPKHAALPAGTVVLAIGDSVTYGMLPDAPIYAELAKEENVILIPEVFAKVLGDPDLKADPIHPNAAGYRKLAEGIAAGLTQSGLLKK